MRRQDYSLATLALILFACASSGLHVKDVIELAPPDAVRLDSTGAGIVIGWQPSIHADRVDFAGYNVYVSTRSLIFAPLKDLPQPQALDKHQHSVKLRNLEPAHKYFVHVRSRDKKGALSLPSLPETIVVLSEQPNH